MVTKRTKMREVFYSVLTLVAGGVFVSPVMILVSIGSVTCAFLAVVWTAIVTAVLFGTEPGRFLIVEMWRSVLRLERNLLGNFS